MRMVEVIISKIKTLKMNKMEEAAAGVDRAIETTATKIKPNHMTRLLITLDAIPCTAAVVFSIMGGFP